MPPANETIREQILLDVIATLAAVVQDSQFWFTLGVNKVVRADAGSSTIDAIPAPAVIVGLGDAEYIDGSQAGNEAYSFEALSLSVGGWVGEASDTPTKLARLECDIRHALMADRQRSGLALDTAWRSTHMLDPDFNDGHSVVVVRFDIALEVKDADLTSSIP